MLQDSENKTQTRLELHKCIQFLAYQIKFESKRTFEKLQDAGVIPNNITINKYGNEIAKVMKNDPRLFFIDEPDGGPCFILAGTVEVVASVGQSSLQAALSEVSEIEMYLPVLATPGEWIVKAIKYMRAK